MGTAGETGMYIPMTKAGSSIDKAPSWLKLQAGEQYIRHWGRACCGSSGKKGTVASSIGVALMTVFAGQFAWIDLDMFKDGGEPSTIRWVMIGVFCMTMLVGIGVVIWTLSKRGSLQAALTNQRILFREKGQLTQIALRDLRVLRAVDNGREKLVQFSAKQHRGPVASLPVKDPVEVIRQIEALALAAGAELK